ncbi:hypothetical protein RFI_29598 [Reticulomyxa filosa]|uniref:Uncharacterized protein n=1 Tax=Reticulomyxa filosa TaxID=46433 RepID=X6M0V8_RETFI|nr:hypothetical protein RFI_29598 [Reticulomyxa filosa]|eukprot:ETO07793.1 hypothetical protein RFI_29598 [Reticulomyxa filosa]
MNFQEEHVGQLNESSPLAQQLGIVPTSDNKTESKPKWFEACDFSFLSDLDTKLSKEQILLKERKREAGHGITEYTYHEKFHFI